MKWQKERKKLLWKLDLQTKLLLLFLLLYFLLMPSTEAIGYQVEGNFIKIYNIYEQYCIDTTTGLQFGVTQAQGCSKPFYNQNEICIQVGSQRRCWKSIPLARYYITSDNTTYINITFNKGLLSNNFNLTYSLYENDHILRQSFFIRNLIATRKYNISYVISNISFNSPLIEINNTIQPITHNKYYANLNEDGFSIIDGLDGKYFHFGYNPLINNYISIRNSVINTTYLNEQLTLGQTKSYLFTYYDPQGTCDSLDEKQALQLGCYGNQYSVQALPFDTLTGGTTEKVAFAFNSSDNILPTGSSFRAGTKTGAWVSSYIEVGIQYNQVSLGENQPNGTWIVNISLNPLASSINTGNLPLVNNNLTKGQVYHFVLDGSRGLQAGDTVQIVYVSPRIQRYTYDYGNHTDAKVRFYSPAGAKWLTRTTSSPLFAIRGNSTENVAIELGNYRPSQPMSLNGTRLMALTTWVGQAMNFPYNMTVVGIGASVYRNSASLPPDNITYWIRDAITLQNLSTGQFLNHTLANQTLQWFNTTFKSGVNLSANRTYYILLACYRCPIIGGVKYGIEQITELGGMIQPGNNSFYGHYSSSISASANGTTITYYSSANTTDDLIYLSGFKFTGVPVPPVIVQNLQVISNIPNAIPRNQTRVFNVQIYNYTSMITNQISCDLNIYNQQDNASIVYTETKSTFTNNNIVFSVPPSVFPLNGLYTYRIQCYTPDLRSYGHLEQTFAVTLNAESEATGNLKNFIFLLWTIIVIGSVLLFWRNLHKLTESTFTIFDLLISLSVHLLLLSLLYLSQNYIINQSIDNQIIMFNRISLVINMILPMFAFLISIIQNLTKKVSVNK